MERYSLDKRAPGMFKNSVGGWVKHDEALAAIAQLQARIDALMLEHCPDEMTPEQMVAWANAQVAAPGFYEAALDAALKA